MQKNWGTQKLCFFQNKSNKSIQHCSLQFFFKGAMQLMGNCERCEQLSYLGGSVGRIFLRPSNSGAWCHHGFIIIVSSSFHHYHHDLVDAFPWFVAILHFYDFLLTSQSSFIRKEIRSPSSSSHRFHPLVDDLNHCDLTKLLDENQHE